MTTLRTRTRRLATIATLTAALATPLAAATPAHAECFRAEVAVQALGGPERVMVDDANCITPVQEDPFLEVSDSGGAPQYVYVRFWVLILEPPIIEPPPLP